MLKVFSYLIIFTFLVVAFVVLMAGTSVSANHSWGTYHWARMASPLTLNLGDNVGATWDSYLALASSDWSVSTVLDTSVVAGKAGNARTCRSVVGRVEVCNYRYGNNGWLGVAQIWISGSHITKGTVRLNDTYFNTTTYNKPAWRQFVMCQEIGHTFGLDHQDENFNNPNLGTCMDYTSDPLTNQHPNAHDYEQLLAIYAHLDSTNTAAQKTSSAGNTIDSADPGSWGRAVRSTREGRETLYVRDGESGEKVFTFVIWADEAAGSGRAVR